MLIIMIVFMVIISRYMEITYGLFELFLLLYSG